MKGLDLAKKYYEEDMTSQHLVFPDISGPHGLEYKMDKWLVNLFNTTMDIIGVTSKSPCLNY